MKIKLIGSALVFQSAIKKEDIELLMKYEPAALTVVNEDKIPQFMVSFKPAGCVSKKGIVFDSATRDENKYALLTLAAADVPAENPQGYLADQFGSVIDYVTQIEAGIPAALERVKAKRDKVAASIAIEL